MAIKIGGTTVVTDGRGLSNITSGAIIGIQSGGTYLGAGATTLNFVGAGNSLRYISATNTIDVVISGSGGGGGAIGVSSSGTLVGTGITNINFVGAAVTNVGLTTSVVTITKTLTVGRRLGFTAGTIPLTTPTVQLRRRNGTTSSVTF
jgi:hypothetical protein